MSCLTAFLKCLENLELKSGFSHVDVLYSNLGTLTPAGSSNMVATLIWLKLLPYTFIPQKQYTGLGKFTLYPRMRFLKFPLGFTSCPKGTFGQKRGKSLFFFFFFCYFKRERAEKQWPIPGRRGQRCVCVLCAQPLSCVWHVATPQTSLPGSSIHGIIQARILEWVATSSARVSSRPRDRTHISYVSCIGRQILYHTHDETLLPLCLSQISGFSIHWLCLIDSHFPWRFN